MKKITFLITLLTISVSFGQTNLIINGDFETGDISSWTGSYGTDAVMAADVVGAGTTHSGTYAGRAQNWGTGATSFLQAVDVTPGQTYIVNFWFTFSAFTPSTNVVMKSFDGATGGANLVLTPIVADNGRNATNNVNYGCGIADLDPTYAWKEAKFSFTVPATGVTSVRFQYYNNNVGYFKYIDDVSIVLDATASLEDLQKFGFNASPNPATDYINLSASKNINKIEIYNVVGQLVESRVLNSNNNRVNVSNLSKGIYIMKAFIEDAVGTYKFVKQ